MFHLGECAIRAPRPPSRQDPTKQWLPNRCRHLSHELPVLKPPPFQGASFSSDVVGPLHKETDRTAQDLQLPPRWSPVLLVLLSGAPRIAHSPSSDRPSTGRATNHDSVRCRGLGQANSEPRTPSAKHSSWSAVKSKCSVVIAVSGGRSDAADPHNQGQISKRPAEDTAKSDNVAGQSSSSDMAAPHKFHFSRLRVSASTFVVSTGGNEPATCEAEAPTSVVGDCVVSVSAGAGATC